ncbi:AlpA family transcriptional regulator [Pseudomonas putida]|uniref:AlpA family transcriptional regulator n=1 Tax=Pseudomonas putida TaxID=303 RepID=UPI000D36C759|nr:AlpA family transcriptional regulator [Pseudomonas putida]PTV65629.1 AlpA family transcriptional regulator [Pseudomonas putida]
MISAATDRFMRLHEVMAVTGLGRNTIYTRMREGTFPRQVHLGPRSFAWLQSSISEWMTSIAAGTSSVHKNDRQS